MTKNGRLQFRLNLTAKLNDWIEEKVAEQGVTKNSMILFLLNGVMENEKNAAKGKSESAAPAQNL
ncbi:hypothetical protein FACS1894188_03590 [Clostridia bacterium]|nr:hypothetical protein FACS1894188_03590 [Clostridia bacterium]